MALFLQRATCVFMWLARITYITRASDEATFMQTQLLQTESDLVQHSTVSGGKRRVSLRKRKRRNDCQPPDNFLFTGASERCLNANSSRASTHSHIREQLTALTLNIPGGRAILLFGTFLGWYRECDVMQSDHDIDIGVFPDDFNNINWPKLGPELDITDGHGKQKFGLKGNWGPKGPKLQKVSGIAAKKMIKSEFGKMDLSVLHQNTSHYIVLHPKTKRTYVYPKVHKGIKLQFQKVKLRGVEVYAPYPADTWATIMFGEDYKTPMNHDDFDTSGRFDLKSVLKKFETEWIGCPHGVSDHDIRSLVGEV